MVGFRRASALVLVVMTAVALWNARTYPPGRGYDADHHITYAEGLIHHGTLPSRATRGESETPPVFYALAGAGLWIGEKVGLGQPLRVSLALNVLYLLGTALLLGALAELVFPGRPLVQLAALAYFALLPVVLKTTAMFHPEALNMFLATLAIYLAARMYVRRDFGWRSAVALGLVLGVEQLVRKIAGVTAAAVVLGLAAALVWRVAPRLQVLRALAVVCVITVAFVLPWRIYLQRTQRPPGPRNQGVHVVLTGSFFYDPGLPAVITTPWRPHYVNRVFPMTYTDIWGDIFGVWGWTAPPPPAHSQQRTLIAQSVLGVVPTILAFAGWFALLVLALRRRRELLPAVILPGLTLLAFLAYTARDLAPDGDVIKATYMLITAPMWALAFGYAVDRIAARRALAVPLAVLLVAAALVDLRFVVYGSPLGFL